MNSQPQLNIQALADGELDPAQARAMAEQIQRDPEARALHENLGAFKKLLQDHEPVAVVPETREFYWSKIRQGIECASAVADREAPHRRLPWLAWLIPAAALAITAVFVLRPAPNRPADSVGTDALAQAAMVGHEIEEPDTGLTTLTFYSAQDSMTVVWVSHVDML